jgi:3-dehydroquinate synthetase
MKSFSVSTQDILPDSNVLFRMFCDRTRDYKVYFGERVLQPDHSLLAALLKGRQTLLVTTPTVARLYRGAFDALAQRHRLSVETLVLECSEENKSLDMVSEICRSALEAGLDRKGVLVALSGGVCSDLVTVAASMVRRGIEYIRVPTTLVGQVDAAVGIKGAVNFGGKKSFLGAFYPPSSVLIDPTFLETLPAAHLRYGLAEIIKIAIVRDAELLDLVADHAPTLIHSSFQNPFQPSRHVLWRAAQRMLEELEGNLYEDRSYKRLVDLGHTFSPAIEAASGFKIHHGEAVAIDIALSATISAELKMIPESDRRRIISAIASVELPIFSEFVTQDVCLRALSEAMNHRAGSLNLVLPTGIGEATFLEHIDDVSVPVLQASIGRLARESQELSSIYRQERALCVKR